MMPVTKTVSDLLYCCFIVGYATLNDAIFTSNLPLECAGIGYVFIIARLQLLKEVSGS
jgi:hypothetical protein